MCRIWQRIDVYCHCCHKSRAIDQIVKPGNYWRQRLADDRKLPLVKPIPAKMGKRHGQGSIVIPSPHDVAKAIGSIPRSKLTTIDRIAKSVAQTHGATIGCTVTTGILAWITANAANEEELEGKKKILPYWRALRANGELNPNYPGGIENLTRRLEAEGHSVIRKGKRFLVDRYEEKLA